MMIRFITSDKYSNYVGKVNRFVSKADAGLGLNVAADGCGDKM